MTPINFDVHIHAERERTHQIFFGNFVGVQLLHSHELARIQVEAKKHSAESTGLYENE